MAKPNTHDFASKRHNSFHWTTKVGSDENDDVSSHNPLPDSTKPLPNRNPSSSVITPKRKLQTFAVSRLRSVISSLSRARPGNNNSGLGSRVVGTLFGSRRGHVHFSVQKDPTSPPAFLIELATPISGLVKEMASGLVRIALECDKTKEEVKEENGNRRHGVTIPRRLVEEPVWRTYCNGKKCGFAARRESGEKEKKVLKALEMVSMGAGVLPETEETSIGGGGGGGGGEIMYMRAKFERIVGSCNASAEMALVFNPSDMKSSIISLNMNGITKLTSANFITWRLQVQALLEAHELHVFISDTDQTPEETVTDADGAVTPNPTVAVWKRQDRLLYSSILGTLSLNVQPVVARATTTREIWTLLHNTYGKPSRAHVKQIKQSLKKSSKGTQSITEYMRGVMAKADQLALLGAALDHEDLLDYIIEGLSEDYKAIVEMVNGRDVPITLEELHEKL